MSEEEVEKALRAEYNIRRTIFRFNLENFEVQRKVKYLDAPDREDEENVLPLSEACGTYAFLVKSFREVEPTHRFLAGAPNQNPKLIDPDIPVWNREEKIGHIDQEGCFHYTKAPDLRTGLGWALATGFFGRERVLSERNLENALKSVRGAESFQKFMKHIGQSLTGDFDHHRELYDLIAKLAERERSSV